MKNMAGLKCVKGRVSSYTWKNETVSFFHVYERSGSFMSHACIILTGRLLSVQAQPWECGTIIGSPGRVAHSMPRWDKTQVTIRLLRFLRTVSMFAQESGCKTLTLTMAHPSLSTVS
jgi:hypothetical protein